MTGRSCHAVGYLLSLPAAEAGPDFLTHAVGLISKRPRCVLFVVLFSCAVMGMEECLSSRFV